MSDSILEVPLIRDTLPNFARRSLAIAKRIAAALTRLNALPADDLSERQLADIGLTRSDVRMIDPRPPCFFGPNAR